MDSIGVEERVDRTKPQMDKRKAIEGIEGISIVKGREKLFTSCERREERDEDEDEDEDQPERIFFSGCGC